MRTKNRPDGRGSRPRPDAGADHGAAPPRRLQGTKAAGPRQDDRARERERERERQTPDHGETETMHGLRAVLAVVRRRPGDVVRIAYARDAEPGLGPLVELARARGLRAELRSPAELGALAQTTNHEGVCIQVRARRWLPPAALADALVRERGVALALDRVRNPYNVGAVVRTAAFFGLNGVVLGAPAPHPALAADAARVAEGGAEDVPLSRTTDLGRTLAQLRERGVLTLGVESDGDDDLLGVARDLPRPLVLVVGHEREGLSPRVRAECQRTARIVGVSERFSLNVAVATSIAIAAVAGVSSRCGAGGDRVRR